MEVSIKFTDDESCSKVFQSLGGCDDPDAVITFVQKITDQDVQAVTNLFFDLNESLVSIKAIRNVLLERHEGYYRGHPAIEAVLRELPEEANEERPGGEKIIGVSLHNFCTTIQWLKDMSKLACELKMTIGVDAETFQPRFKGLQSSEEVIESLQERIAKIETEKRMACRSLAEAERRIDAIQHKSRSQIEMLEKQLATIMQNNKSKDNNNNINNSADFESELLVEENENLKKQIALLKEEKEREREKMQLRLARMEEEYNATAKKLESDYHAALRKMEEENAAKFAKNNNNNNNNPKLEKELKDRTEQLEALEASFHTLKRRIELNEKRREKEREKERKMSADAGVIKLDDTTLVLSPSSASSPIVGKPTQFQQPLPQQSQQQQHVEYYVQQTTSNGRSVPNKYVDRRERDADDEEIDDDDDGNGRSPSATYGIFQNAHNSNNVITHSYSNSDMAHPRDNIRKSASFTSDSPSSASSPIGVPVTFANMYMKGFPTATPSSSPHLTSPLQQTADYMGLNQNNNSNNNNNNNNQNNMHMNAVRITKRSDGPPPLGGGRDIWRDERKRGMENLGPGAYNVGGYTSSSTGSGVKIAMPSRVYGKERGGRDLWGKTDNDVGPGAYNIS